MLKTPIFLSRPYEEFTPKLLEQYHDYMMAELETRIWILLSQINLENEDMEEKYEDKTMQQVFEWALKNIEVVSLADYPESELIEEDFKWASPFELTRRRFLAHNRTLEGTNSSNISVIDADCYPLVIDVGLFFGQCLVQKISGAKWGTFKKKNYHISNHLVIVFENGATFCPFTEVEILIEDYKTDQLSFKDRLAILEKME